MSITEVRQAIGSWEVRLKEETPRDLLDALTFYGHIAVMPGRVDPAQYGDSILSKARYVGVYRGRDAQDSFTLKGSGMAFWLGDEDDKGDVFETAVTLTAATFAGSVAALLPPGGSVVAGTINAIAGTYTGRHQWETSRKAITYVTDIFGGEWRINGNATLDAGTVAQLYVTDPKALLLRRDPGSDLVRKSIPGKMAMGTDVEDLTTRVVLLAEGEGSTIATGTANAPATPYKDIYGNALRAVRLVSESETSSGNAAARAQLQLNRFLNARRSVALSTSEYDVKGTFQVGDYLYVYDPGNGFFDAALEVPWNGGRINPMALRCVEMSWPVPAGWTVAFRDINGLWIDLSRYYIPEGGDTTIVVGELSRGMASVGGEAVGIRPNLTSGGDESIPNSPTFSAFQTGNYQASDSDWTKAAVLASWSLPLNTDSSTIVDGDHYEIRYRVNAFMGYQVRWGQVEVYRWGALETSRWGAPISGPIPTAGQWHTIYIAWGQLQFLVQELTPGVEYEFQIRAVDVAGHIGPYSASSFVIPSGDLFAPAQPAAPVVASSRIAVQVTHSLGKASGGTFNLEPDLHHFNVHIGPDSLFVPSDANEVGRLLANAGLMKAQIPAVGTFQIEQTTAIFVKVVAVDRAGNKSSPSVGVQATVQLIDNAHISDLTVSKVTAGTINAAWILAGSIKTATTGARVEIDSAGVRAYNGSGQNTVDIKSSDGSATVTGALKTKVDGAGVEIRPGTTPVVVLKPNAADDHEAHLFCDYWSGESFVSAELSVRKLNGDNTTTIDGGKFLATEQAAIMSHQSIADDEQFIGLGYPYGNEINVRGKWSRSFVDSKGANYVDTYSIGSGFSGVTFGYGLTMVGNICPIYSMSGATGVDFYHRVVSPSQTGHTIEWSGSDAHDFFEWIPRC